MPNEAKPAQQDIPFDPNDGEIGKALLPSSVMFDLPEKLAPKSADQYVLQLEHLDKREESTIEKCLKALNKAIALPPTLYSYTRMSSMPDPQNKGVLQWPGIPPEAIRKILAENVAPQLIIGMRVDDVTRYSRASSHPWRPGWRIELMEAKKHPSRAELIDMREAEQFLCCSNVETGYSQAIMRDRHGLTDFQRFLGGMTRETLSFDGIAIWTQRDLRNRIKGYSLLPAGQIRLVDRRIGYEGNKDIFAVGVDETGNVQITFEREQLVWYTRNIRTDPIVGPYGYPEPEMAMKFIQGFQNSLDLNLDTFNRSGVPNGILVLKGGGWNQKQVDVLSRIWLNLKRGVTKSWALPVIAPPKDGELTILDMQELKDKDVRYEDLMNMVAAGVCIIYRFPPRRLGYRVSGKGPDNQPIDDQRKDMVDEDDPGLAPLLTHFENVINEYLIWTRWPHLRFAFSGKNPKEDAREYEARRNAMTYKESRAEADMPDLATQVKDPDLKLLAEVMEMAPLDPNLAGVFQTVAGAFLKAKLEPKDDGAGEDAAPGNRMAGKKDPAKSEAHGHTSGVRRDSRAESARATRH
jgi:hypothetical protein